MIEKFIEMEYLLNKYYENLYSTVHPKFTINSHDDKWYVELLTDKIEHLNPTHLITFVKVDVKRYRIELKDCTGKPEYKEINTNELNITEKYILLSAVLGNEYTEEVIPIKVKEKLNNILKKKKEGLIQC